MTVTTARELTEVELLHFYLGMRIAKGGKGISIAQALEDYSEYRRQLDEMRSSLREGEEASARGESKPLDLDKFQKEIRDHIEALGNTR